MTNFPYTIWPSADDALARAAAAGVILRVTASDNRVTNTVDAVIAEIAQRTQRQFIADAQDATRLYDGSGSPAQEVDEMVSLTVVNVVGLDLLPAYTLSDAALTHEQGKPLTRLTLARGSVPCGRLFPAGRQNIAVTGKFGYGPAIPAVLWEAAEGEMAVRLSREGLFTPNGRVSADKAGDEEKQYALPETDALHWHADFEEKMRLYARPQGRRLRSLRNRML